MKYAINRGQKIAYKIYGHGPSVILQHGLFEDHRIWEKYGYVDRLAQKYQVIAVDSLGHGASDKPVVKNSYKRSSRAGDIIAVLDAEKINKAHYIGYSMGGWLGMGLIKHYPDRLLSCTIGGFNPDGAGSRQTLDRTPFDLLLRAAGIMDPDHVKWVTEEIKPALAFCKEELTVLEIPLKDITASNIPVHLWVGKHDDSNYPGIETVSDKFPDSKISIIDGDHSGTLKNRESVEAVFNFLKEYSAY